MSFDYDLAFSRNLGWLTDAEFEKIRHFKIAIAGMGGVGGSHLIALIRMGFCRFVIADFDQFEIQNFNRQYGADTTSINKNKCAVMKDLANKINPLAKIEMLQDGVTPMNIDQFLDDVDLYVDGLDLFELKIRSLIFKRSFQLQIPCVTSAPLGFGASCLVFDSQSMTFDDYFQFRTGKDLENVLKFVLGLAPSLMQVKYLLDKKYSNLAKNKTSSTPAGCFAASAVVCAEAIKILFHRGPQSRAPKVIHFDFYLQKMKKNYYPWGLRNPLLKVKLYILKKILEKVNADN